MTKWFVKNKGTIITEMSIRREIHLDHLLFFPPTFKMLSLQILHMGKNHMHWDSRKSAPCTLHHQNTMTAYSSYLFSAGCGKGASNSPTYQCNDWSREPPYVTLQISRNWPHIQQIKAKRCCSHYSSIIEPQRKKYLYGDYLRLSWKQFLLNRQYWNMPVFWKCVC